MKTTIAMALLIFSINLYANETIIPVNDLRKLTIDEATETRKALIVSNQGNTSYGKCSFYYMNKPEVEVYVDENNTQPLIIIVFTKTREWLKINSDETMKEIISVQVGKFSESIRNTGTIINPIFKKILIVANSNDCKSI